MGNTVFLSFEFLLRKVGKLLHTASLAGSLVHMSCLLFCATKATNLMLWFDILYMRQINDISLYFSLNPATHFQSHLHQHCVVSGCVSSYYCLNPYMCRRIGELKLPLVNEFEGEWLSVYICEWLAILQCVPHLMHKAAAAVENESKRIYS